MTRLMRDAADAANIPLRGLDIVAGYPNRTPPWSGADWRQFTGLPWVTIDVHGTAPVCDVLATAAGTGRTNRNAKTPKGSPTR